MHQIRYIASTRHPEQACGPKMAKFIVQDGRRPPFWNLQKTWITPEPFVRFSPNLACSFVSTSPRHQKGQNRHFSKSKMAADEKPKFTKNWIMLKRFVIYPPNLVCRIYSAPGTSLWSQNGEIHNPRWPPAAILKFTKTWITPEPFIRFSSSLAWRFVLKPPRQRKC